MSANALGSPGGTRSGRRLSSPVLVGRETELRRLVEAATSPPAVVLVDGEAGVGKSRLVRELAREAGVANRRVLLGRCHQLSEPCPLAPVIGALGGVDGWQPLRPMSPLLGELRPLFPELAERLPPEPKPSRDRRVQRPKIFPALREFLEGLGPTVWILEDLQWADEVSLEFLSALVAVVPNELALVLTCRTETFESSSPLLGLTSALMSHGVGTTITVEPLSPDGVQALVNAMLDINSTSHEFATRLHEWTGGIPFVVEQVVLEWRDGNDLSGATPLRAPALRELAVPRAVRDSVLQRLARLSADARLMAWAAAVLGMPAEEELLSDVAGLCPDRGAAGLIDALSAGALEEHGNGLYGFRHALATRAVYAAITGPRRRRLHLRAGRSLERRHEPQPLAQIARHLKEGGSEKWPQYAEAAAKAASAAGEDRVAVALLEDALSVTELPKPARLRMALALGEAALYSVPPSGAARIIQRILDEETLSAGMRGTLRYSLSRLLGHAGDTAGWHREAVRAVGELRQRPALGARTMIHLAQPLRRSEGQPDDHAAWLDRAVEAVGGETNRVARIAVSAQRAAILVSLGDPKGWAAVRHVPTGAHTAEERLQLLRAYHSLAETALSVGHYARAESFLFDADRIQDQIGHQSWTVWLETAHASMDWSCGRWEGLENRLRRLCEQTACTPGLSFRNQFPLGSLLLARGQLVEAERILESALETSRRTDNLSQVVNVSGRLGRVHLSREDAQAARDVTALALTPVRNKGVWVLGRVVAREAVHALLACEERESVREVVAEFAAGLRGLDAPAARATLAWCRGALAEADHRHGQAARYFAQSDDRWSRLPNRYEAARAREQRARCLLLAGDSGSAGGVLIDALETFRRLGADGDARRVRAQLKAQGLWRGGRTGYGEVLSPREAQVARLAGLGQTNREVADALFISTRTVEGHVAASLRKLGLASRHQLGSLDTPPGKDA